MALHGPATVGRRIALCREALELVDRDLWPAQWAELHLSLARYLFERDREDPAWDGQESLTELSMAGAVFTFDEYPNDWATSEALAGDVHLSRAHRAWPREAADAVRCYESALKVVRHAERPREWAIIQSNLGEAYRLTGTGDAAANIEHAIEHLASALTGLEDSGETELEGQVRLTLALALTDRELGDLAHNLQSARTHLNRVLSRGESAGPQELWARVHLALGNTHLRDLDVQAYAQTRDQAFEHFEKALIGLDRNRRPLDWSAAQTGMAIVHSNRGETRKAIAHFREALAGLTRERFPERWAWAHYNLGNEYHKRKARDAKNNLMRAASHYGTALEVFLRATHASARLKVLTSLAELHFEQGHWRDAYGVIAEASDIGRQILDDAIVEKALAEQVARLSLLGADGAYCLARLGRFGEAVVTFEESRALLARNRLLLGVELRHAGTSASRTALQSAWQNVRRAERALRDAETSIGTLSESLAVTRSRLRDEIRTVRASHPDFMRQSQRLGEILSLAPPGGALVVPWVTAVGAAVFVLPHGLREVSREHMLFLKGLTDRDLMRLLDGRDRKAGWIQGYLQLQNDGPFENWLATIDDVKAELWESIIGPVHARLRKLGVKIGAPVVLLPQGKLRPLPLHLASPRRQDKGRSLLEDFTVSYAPGTFALSICRQRRSASGRPRVLAVANPTRDLPFATAECCAIQRAFPKGTMRSLQGIQANRAAVLAEAADRTHLHFASHASFHWSNVELSALNLADGSLTLEEITDAEVDLTALQLVTLSACETGVTQVFRRVAGNVFTRAGDEGVGLVGAFLQVGARAVLSTLWPVGDVSSALLMWKFYQNLIRERMPAAAALQGAQCWLRDQSLDEVVKRIVQIRGASLSEMDGEASASWDEVDLELEQLSAEFGAGDRPFEHPHFWGAFVVTGEAHGHSSLPPRSVRRTGPHIVAHVPVTERS